MAEMDGKLTRQQIRAERQRIEKMLLSRRKKNEQNARKIAKEMGAPKWEPLADYLGQLDDNIEARLNALREQEHMEMAKSLRMCSIEAYCKMVAMGAKYLLDDYYFDKEWAQDWVDDMLAEANNDTDMDEFVTYIRENFGILIRATETGGADIGARSTGGRLKQC